MKPNTQIDILSDEISSQKDKMECNIRATDSELDAEI